MKKIIILMMSFLMLVGCSQKSADNIESTETTMITRITQKNADNIKTTETAASLLATEAETEAEIENIPAWQSAYREELYNFINSDKYNADEACFSIYDINNDDIPELFISKGTYHLARNKVYTFTDCLIDLGEYGSEGFCQFYPNKNTLCSWYMGQGENISKYYQLNDDGSISELAYFYDNSGREWDTIVYKINGVEMTEEEYNAAKDEYRDADNYIHLGRDLKLSKEVVDGVFNGASDWKECYKKFLYGLTEVMDEYSRFSVYDVTGDGVPELFVSDGLNTGCSCSVYTFKNNLNYIDDCGAYGATSFSPEHNLFISEYISYGYRNIWYDKLDENYVFQTETHLFEDAGAAATEKELSYKINHEDVSPEEYKNTYEEYRAIDDFISLGRDYAFTEENIQKALEENY